MSSKRDLVEAHSFNRRRFVTAFTSGAPGGREVEAPRHGRTIIGGAVLAALVLAGSALTGFFKPTTPDGWKDGGLVVGKESGARFFAYQGHLYPVINTTSARLLLPAKEFEVNFVPDKDIAKAPIGATIGILDAPDQLPAKGDLVQKGLSACTDSAGKPQVRIGNSPTAKPRPKAALVAKSDDGATYVIAGGHRYAAPSAALLALGLSNETPWNVSGAWLDLFPLGAPLKPFAVADAGQPSAASGLPDSISRVGSVATVGDQHFLVLNEGLAQLNDFALSIFQLGSNFAPVEVDASEIAGVAPVTAAKSPVPASWPKSSVHGYGGTSACALLTNRGKDAPPRVQFASPVGAAKADTPIVIERGHGVLMQVSTAGIVDRGTRFLVDSTGTAYPLADPADEIQRRLGFGGVTPLLVTQPWVKLFASGPSLDPRQARLKAASQ